MLIHRSILSVAALSFGFALLTGLVGCDNEDAQARREAGKALDEASTKMEVLSLSDSSQGEAEFTERVYTSALSDLSGGSAGSSESEALKAQEAAKAAISAKAKMGLAHIELDRAEDINRELVPIEMEVSQALDSAVIQASIASSAGSFDYSETLVEIQSREDEIKSRKKSCEYQAREEASKIEDLEIRIKSELAEYNRLLDEAATAKAEAMKAPLMERQLLIEQAAAISREAGDHQVQAATYEAMLDMAKPALEQWKSQIAQTEVELISAEHSRSSLESKKRLSDRESAQAQADFNESLVSLNNSFATLAQRRQDELVPQFDKAISVAREAEAMARRAGVRDEAGRMRSAEAGYLLMQIQLRKLSHLESFAGLVSRLTAHADLLNRGQQDAALLADLREQIEQTRKEAQEACQGAFETLQSARTESGKHLAVTIADSWKDITGEELAGFSEMVAEEAAMKEAAAKERLAAAEAAGGEPAALMQSLIAQFESGEYAGLFEYVYADNDSEREMISVFTEIVSAMDRLNTATSKYLDRGLYEMMADPDFWDQITSMLPADMQSMMGGGMMGGGDPSMAPAGGMDTESFTESLEQLKAINPSTLTFRYNSDGTMAWVEGVPMFADTPLVLVNDQWLIDIPSPTVPSAEEAAMTSEILGIIVRPITGAFDNVTARTEADEFGDEWSMISVLVGEVQKAVETILPQVMEKIMGGMMPEGGMMPPGG